MLTLLHLDSSPLPYSITRQLTQEFVKTWKLAHPTGTVIYRDLAVSVPAPVDAAWVAAAYTPEEARTTEQSAILAYSDELIAELEEADEYVFGVAMHNFSVPAVFKLWIDQVSRRGRTFAFGEQGPQGLLRGKKATVLEATGGVYTAGSPAAPMNFIDPYLKAFLGFIGIKDVSFIAAAGVAHIGQSEADRALFLKPTLEQVRAFAA